MVVKRAIPLKKITAWSYSRFELYNACPAKANYSINERIKEPSNQALDNGARIHDLAKEYVRGLRKQLPKELENFDVQFRALRKLKAEAEIEWAFDSDWEPVSWSDWDNCWVRIKVDAARDGGDTVFVVDYKTGRNKEADVHENQRSLYALGALLMYPKAKRVFVEHWYLEHSSTQSSAYTRKDLPKLQRMWEEKVTPMMNDTRFAPNPTNACNWCWFRRGNRDYGPKGGPCPY